MRPRPRPRVEPQTCRRSRVFSLVVTAFMMVAAGPRPSSAGVPPEVQALAQQLATVPRESGACSIDSATPLTLPPAFASTSAALQGGPAGVRAMCALPYANGRPGGDCTGRHTIQYQVLGASPSATVTAELIALDTAGRVMNSVGVRNGEQVHMASRLSAADWRFGRGNREYTVFAPLPLLKVTVEDGDQRVEAYCTNVPWVDVIQPAGGVVTQEDSGSETNVYAAVPLTNPSSLQLLVDGDDLLADVPSFIGCTPSSPCDGTANINGANVPYTGLEIDIASNIAALASNTIKVTLHDLSCGGHNVQVVTSKLPGSLKNPASEQCNIDDLRDLGRSSVFAVSISNPVPGQITPIVPTPVQGEVCAGTQITEVNINGTSVSLAGQTHNMTAGGDLYSVIIDTSLMRTDIKAALVDAQDNALGTFDAGTNRVLASAREIGGRRAYKRVLFATGDVTPIGVDVNATIFQSSAMQAAISQQLQARVQAQVHEAALATTAEIQNAFVVGLSAEGTQTLFDKLCSEPTIDGKTAGQLFQETVSAAIRALDDPPIVIHDLSVPCAPDPDVTLTIPDEHVVVGNQLSCAVDFFDGEFKVRMDLPDVSLRVNAFGEASDCCTGVEISGHATASITGINLQFTVTEDNLLNNTFSAANFDGGATVTNQGNISVDFEGLSEVCDVLVTIFTFGAVDLTDIDFGFVTEIDFSDAVRANQPDPVRLQQIKVDETVVANFDQKLSGVVSSVRITPAGISAGLKGEFATTVIDADVESTPGITLTPVTQVPTFGNLRSQGAQDALIGLADDTINMMFASLTAAGKLKAGDDQGCVDTTADVGSLLPADCNTISLGGDNIATAEARGYCQAIRNTISHPGPANTTDLTFCDGLSYTNAAMVVDPFLSSIQRGACHGASYGHNIDTTVPPNGTADEDVCNFVFGRQNAPGFFDAAQYGACALTPYFNLKQDQSLLFCAKGAVPPRMVFPNSGAPGGLVPTALRVNDFSVSLVIDRTGGGVESPVPSLPGCFGAATTSDCNVFSSCLDLNLNFGMQFLTCSDGKPGFKAQFDSIQIVNRDIGVVCSGATSPTTDAEVLDASSDDTITIPIASNAGQLSPDICGAGLDLGLGQAISCTTPQILSLEADGDPALKDFLGVTCTIQ